MLTAQRKFDFRLCRKLSKYIVYVSFRLLTLETSSPLIVVGLYVFMAHARVLHENVCKMPHVTNARHCRLGTTEPTRFEGRRDGRHKASHKVDVQLVSTSSVQLAHSRTDRTALKKLLTSSARRGRDVILSSVTLELYVSSA